MHRVLSEVGEKRGGEWLGVWIEPTDLIKLSAWGRWEENLKKRSSERGVGAGPRWRLLTVRGWSQVSGSTLQKKKCSPLLMGSSKSPDWERCEKI